jgi:tripartite ATP-independent transporter DctP family solute receptor
MRTNFKKLTMSSMVFLMILTFTMVVQAADVKWRMASKMPPKSPEGMAFQLFIDRVGELSGGKMEISLFPSEQLGKTEATLEQLQAGILQIYAEGDAYLKKYVPDMKFTSLPFFFNDRKHWANFMSSDMVGGWLNEVAEKHNIMVLGKVSDFVRGPYRVMVATKAVNSLDDLKGMKLRMYSDELSLTVWKHLGMNTIILPWTEVYEALGRGVVQAANSPMALVESMKFYEQAKYIIRHDEFPQGIAFMTNYKAYKALSPELQKVLLTAHGDACSYSAEIMNKSAEESIERMKSKGVSYTIIDRKPFVERANSLYREMESKGDIPKGFMDSVAKMAD